MSAMSASHPRWSEFLALLEGKVRVGPNKKRCPGTGRKELTKEALSQMGFTQAEIDGALLNLGGYACDCHIVGLHNWP